MKKSDSFHSSLAGRNMSEGQKPGKKVLEIKQFSLSKVTSFLLAPKPGATPVACSVLLSPHPPQASPREHGCAIFLQKGRSEWDDLETTCSSRAGEGMLASGLGHPRHPLLSAVPP